MGSAAVTAALKVVGCGKRPQDLRGCGRKYLAANQRSRGAARAIAAYLRIPISDLAA